MLMSNTIEIWRNIRMLFRTEFIQSILRNDHQQVIILTTRYTEDIVLMVESWKLKKTPREVGKKRDEIIKH